MEESDSQAHLCPLCSLQFEGEDCHGACPTSAGCSMIRCPSCGYEFVEGGALADAIRSLFAKVAAMRAGKGE